MPREFPLRLFSTDLLIDTQDGPSRVTQKYRNNALGCFRTVAPRHFPKFIFTYIPGLQTRERHCILMKLKVCFSMASYQKPNAEMLWREIGNLDTLVVRRYNRLEIHKTLSEMFNCNRLHNKF